MNRKTSKNGLSSPNLKKMFNAEVRTKDVRGPIYKLRHYHIDTGNCYLSIGRYKFKDGDVSYEVMVHELTNLKKDTPEYKKALHKHGTLLMRDGYSKIYKPLKGKTFRKESDLIKFLGTFKQCVR